MLVRLMEKQMEKLKAMVSVLLVRKMVMKLAQRWALKMD